MYKHDKQMHINWIVYSQLHVISINAVYNARLKRGMCFSFKMYYFVL